MKILPLLGFLAGAFASHPSAAALADIPFQTAAGANESLKKYAGQSVLVVNVALPARFEPPVKPDSPDVITALE